MRAITLEVNEVSGVAGMLVPGCRVDLVTTLPGEAGQMVGRTIARNLQIVAIGRHISDAGKDEAPDAAPARTVTILATPRQAQTIDLAGHIGSPRLVLRGSRDSRLDLQTDLDGVTVAELRGISGERGGWIGMLKTAIETVAKASPQQNLFSDNAQPTTKPAESSRTVMVIRNTKEQAVQVDQRYEPKPTPVAGTDPSELKTGN